MFFFCFSNAYADESINHYNQDNVQAFVHGANQYTYWRTHNSARTRIRSSHWRESATWMDIARPVLSFVMSAVYIMFGSLAIFAISSNRSP